MGGQWKPPAQECTATANVVKSFYRDSSDAPGAGPIRTVSLVLASYYSPDAGCAYPSVRTLAQACRVGTETVTNAVKALVAAGEWKVVSVPYRETRRNVYVPTLVVGTWPSRSQGRATVLAEQRAKAAAAKRAKAVSGPTDPGTADPRPVAPISGSPVAPISGSPVGPDEVFGQAGEQVENPATAAAAAKVIDFYADPFATDETPAPATRKTAKKTGARTVDPLHAPAAAIVKPWWDEHIAGTGSPLKFMGVVGLVKTSLGNDGDPTAIRAALDSLAQSRYGITNNTLHTALLAVTGRTRDTSRGGEGGRSDWSAAIAKTATTTTGPTADLSDDSDLWETA